MGNDRSQIRQRDPAPVFCDLSANIPEQDLPAQTNTVSPQSYSFSLIPPDNSVQKRPYVLFLPASLCYHVPITTRHIQIKGMKGATIYEPSLAD